MRWADIPWRPAPKLLRQFATLWMVFFGGLAAWRAFVVHDTGRATLALAATAVVVGVIGLLMPAAVRPIFVGWMVLVFPIGWVVTRTLLLLMFALLVTPIAMVFRLRGRDPLYLRPRRDRESYWLAKPPPGDVAGYFRQY